jgi:hypothetical protein
MSGICGKPKLGFRFRAMFWLKGRMSAPGIVRRQRLNHDRSAPAPATSSKAASLRKRVSRRSLSR